jgi:hypothetical protein
MPLVTVSHGTDTALPVTLQTRPPIVTSTPPPLTGWTPSREAVNRLTAA